MTPVTRRHQIVVQKIRLALESVASDEFRIVWEQEIRLADATRRNPDVMVVQASADDLDGYRYDPADVTLAIEVVSPGTQTIDRLHKPAEYAAAKIEHYWYVEISPQIVVHTYRLGETGRYLESGLFKEGDTVAAAGLGWARLAVSDLVP
jgi:Uma2 family endonuclease